MGHSFRMAWIVDMWAFTVSLLISNEKKRKSGLETVLKVEKGIRPFHLMADAKGRLQRKRKPGGRR